MATHRGILTETFAPLLAIPGLRHTFVCRQSGLNAALTTDREAALSALRPVHSRACRELGFRWQAVATAEQVHGDRLSVVVPDRAGRAPSQAPGADGLICRSAGILLGIYVADCAAVSLVDPRTRSVGLLHSGKRGSELGIVGKAVTRMADYCATNPSDLIVHLSPCIRPPLYETDLPTLIRDAALDAGVLPCHYHDCGVSTGEHLERYYSYRMEKGATGRMLALLGWQE